MRKRDISWHTKWSMLRRLLCSPFSWKPIVIKMPRISLRAFLWAWNYGNRRILCVRCGRMYRNDEPGTCLGECYNKTDEHGRIERVLTGECSLCFEK